MDESLDVVESWLILFVFVLFYLLYSQVPCFLECADMDRIMVDFVVVTERAVEVEFDFLEIYMVHGYLFGAFISVLINLCDDEYGGDLAG